MTSSPAGPRHSGDGQPVPGEGSPCPPAGKASHLPLVVAALVFTGAALASELLWFARRPPQGGGMVYAVGRLGWRVELSPSQHETYLIAAALVGLCSVAAALVLAVRAFRKEGHRVRAGGGWRLAAGAGIVVVCTIPLFNLVGWAAGGLHWRQVLGAAWERRYFFRNLETHSLSQLFWLASALVVGSYLIVGRLRWPAGAVAGVLDRLRRLPRWVTVGALCLVVAGLSAGYLKGIFGGEPVFGDSVTVYVQARLLARGRVAAPLPGGRAFFDPAMCPVPGCATFAFFDDRWMAAYEPAASALYAVGILAGCPWLVGPLLGAGVVAAAYLLAREWFGSDVAMTAVPVLALSPWLILISGEYLSHAPCALFVLAFLLGAWRTLRGASWRTAAVAGLFLGLAAVTRPVTALGLCLPTAAVWTWWLIRRPRQAWRPTAAFAAGLLLPMLGLAAYNAVATGSPTTFPRQIAWRSAEARAGLVGDYANRPWSPAKGLSNLLELPFRFNAGALRWPVPMLAVLLGTLLIARPLQRGHLRSRGPLLLALSSIGTLLVIHTRWVNVPLWHGGPRYLFEALPLFAILVAAALHVVWRALKGAGAPPVRVRATICIIAGLSIAYTGARAVVTDLNFHPEGTPAEAWRLFRAVRGQATRPAVVFVPTPERAHYTWLWLAALGQNDASLSGPVIYARDLGPRNRRLARDLPGRHYYRYDHEQARLLPIEPLRLDAPDGSPAAGQAAAPAGGGAP
ncbi:MAG: ArnT family glycosyltransferase [Planctomycetota bacterium]